MNEFWKTDEITEYKVGSKMPLEVGDGAFPMEKPVPYIPVKIEVTPEGAKIEMTSKQLVPKNAKSVTLGPNGLEFELHTEEPYDSMIPTLDHVNQVQENMLTMVQDMIHRSHVHDRSKFGPEEKPHFDRLGENLKNLVVNTPEYKASLAELKPALDHHYANNSHHPEFHALGVNGMTLTDLCEMLADWKAASMRNKGQTLNLSSSFTRFNFTQQLAMIFYNTAREYGWTDLPCEVPETLQDLADRVTLNGATLQIHYAEGLWEASDGSRLTSTETGSGSTPEDAVRNLLIRLHETRQANTDGENDGK